MPTPAATCSRASCASRSAKLAGSPDALTVCAPSCPYSMEIQPMRALRYLVLAGLVSAAVSVQAAPVTYKMDPTHTMVLFSWNHFGFSNPTANIGIGDGTIVFDEKDPAKSSVD